MALKPHDIVVALALTVDPAASQRTLATQLHLGLATVNASRARLVEGALMTTRGEVQRAELAAFLIGSVRHLYPTKPGAHLVGIVTGSNCPGISGLIGVHERIPWVWASYLGAPVRGRCIAPLYRLGHRAALDCRGMHALLALVDILRVGRPEATHYARRELRRRILDPDA